MLKKSKVLTGFSLSELKGVTVADSGKLLKEASKAVDTDLTGSCSVVSVLHYQELKALILNVKS